MDLPLGRQAAVADPIGFVDYPGMMVIDEIQRVPELLLPIKVQVDGDPRAGRYLLSGSARVLSLRALPDTLPRRVETIELWPFSQGEIDEALLAARGAQLLVAANVGRDARISPATALRYISLLEEVFLIKRTLKPSARWSRKRLRRARPGH